jgi:murein L,D-transpeptidase YcbB/YkuD
MSHTDKLHAFPGKINVKGEIGTNGKLEIRLADSRDSAAESAHHHAFLRKAGSSVQTLSKYGSSGSEVRKSRRRLKKWGYYGGDVDGIYGTQKRAAVTAFQKKNGLAADGIAGPATLAKLGISASGAGRAASAKATCAAGAGDLRRSARRAVHVGRWPWARSS